LLLLAVAGAAIGGGLSASAGGLGVLASVPVLVAVLRLAGQRQRSRRC
jgi:hypothetical protein